MFAKEDFITLLVNPPIPDCIPNKEYGLPLALLYLAGYLKRREKSIELLDFNIYKPWELNSESTDTCVNILIEKLQEIKPSLIGFNCLFSGQFPSVRNLSQIAKRIFPHVPIVIGGIHATTFPLEILKNCPEIDFIVIGEGENQLLNLVSYLKQEIENIEEISDGFAYRDNGNIIIRPKLTFFDNVDDLQFPAYDIIDFKNYQHATDHWHNPRGLPIGVSVPLISSRSCPNKCNFCSNYLLMGPKFRARTADSVVNEIEFLYKSYNINHFSFMDDNVSFSKKRILNICQEIVNRNLEIQFETPSGLMMSKIDQEVIEALIGAGWVRGALPIESGSDYIRNEIMGKKLTKEKIYEINKLIEKYPHLYLKSYFIIGMPEDTHETLMDSYHMIENLNVNEITVTNVVPFPGTKLFDQCVRDDLLINMDLENIWRGDWFFFTNNKQFFLKPYSLSFEDLQYYRSKFDSLILKKQKLIKKRNLRLSN
jgi:anaerobic magnesium-protoporphyrin IX monomethyl ester cyclase